MRPSPLTASTFPDMPLDLVDRIRSFPLFNSAPDDFLAAIGKHLRPQIHGAHDLILREGDDAKAMYWLVRGVVAVTSRDGEAVYAELTPGAFFGEIGVLMDVPRTATIVARSKCLLMVLTKENLQTELPRYPDMEKAIRQEAEERLTILAKKQQERLAGKSMSTQGEPTLISGGLALNSLSECTAPTNGKKRKSPSPGIIEDPAVGGSALGSGYVNVRKTLRELPLFATLPPDILHFLGLSAQPKSYAPFSNIIVQGSPGNDIYFIVRGEAEVVHEQESEPGVEPESVSTFLRPRLTAGQYFGEVASLGLSRGRTATVRSITSVECLMISGDALDELWRRCPPGLKHQVEETARMRYVQKVEEQAAGAAGKEDRFSTQDVKMQDPGSNTQINQLASPFGAWRDPWGPVKILPATASVTLPLSQSIRRHSVPNVVFTNHSSPSSPTKNGTFNNEAAETRQPSDPDPFLSVDMENIRNRRRSSLAPPAPSTESSSSSPFSSTPFSSTPSVSNNSSSLQVHPAVQTDSSSSNSSPLKLFSFPPQAPPPDTTEKSEKSAASIIEGFNGINVQEGSPPRGFKKARTSSGGDYGHVYNAATSSVSSPSASSSPFFSETALVLVFQRLEFIHQIRAAGVCRRWRRILTTASQLCTHVDLSPYSSRINDYSLSTIIAPFIGTRAVEMDIRNCFHVTDKGFQVLWQRCGKNVKAWRMKSVWDVSASQILDMSENAPGLEEMDWSNCRKVGDNLLARVVGWVVLPQPPPLPPVIPPNKNVVISSTRGRHAQSKGQNESHDNSQDDAHSDTSKQQRTQQQRPGPATGTVIGCPHLQILDLSYCKHITDRSMAHLAAHAASRLRSLSLTRCTSITDAGFQAWAPYRFTALTHLCLADCTYLSDSAIVSLVNAAKHLTHLDLSFCCALSDTATEVVALGLPLLQELRLAFCGSAVSDASLRCIALHLNDLRGLSVRGCVRVTGVGVDHVLDGCGRLAWLDASQCKNLASWIASGGIGRWGFDERTIGRGHRESLLGQSSWKAANRQSLGLDPTCPPRVSGPVPLMRGQRRRARKPVMFIIEKGPRDGLR